mgnify:CR=1 FL=1|tara:strand:+ start:168 stop:1097 length:930 start_codon:yes stop_codon:yes gene_type:complete
MSNKLAVITKENIVTVFKPGGSADITDRIIKEVLSFIPDVSTAKGRANITANCTILGKAEKMFEEARKELKSDHKAIVDGIDSEGKIARDKLKEAKKKTRKPLTDWEDEQKAIKEAKAEEERKAEEARLLAIQQEEEDKRIAEENRIELIRLEQEARAKEIQAREDALQAKENEQKLKEQQAKQAEDQKIREAQVAQEAKEKAEANAAQAIEQAKQDKLRAEIAKENAEKQAKQDQAQAVEAEKQRHLAQQKAEQDATNAREADKAHKGKIHSQSLNNIVEFCGLDQGQAKKVIEQIYKKNISNITINY